MAKKTTVLIHGKPVDLVWNSGAQFRLQSLKGGSPTSADISNPRRAFYAITVWVWATLPKELRQRFDGPEDVSEALDETKLQVYVDAVTAAVEEATPAEDSEKKAGPSSPAGSE